MFTAKNLPLCSYGTLISEVFADNVISSSGQEIHLGCYDSYKPSVIVFISFIF